MNSKFSIAPIGWKYRIVQELIEGEDMENSYPARFSFTIREVWHKEDGTPLYYSEETIPYGESKFELQEDLLKMINALIYPVILESDLNPRENNEN